MKNINSLSLIAMMFLLATGFQSCLVDDLFDSLEKSPEQIRQELDEKKQNMLDSGMTPLEVIDNLDSTESKILTGLYYQGGLIIDFNELTGEGIIVSEEDLGEYEWGCHDIEIEDLVCMTSSDYQLENGESYNEGEYNSSLVLSSVCGSLEPGDPHYYKTAFQACDEYEHDGFDDWFLPGRTLLDKIEYLGIDGRYWSSTGVIDEPFYAWAVKLGNSNGCTAYETWLGTTAYNRNIKFARSRLAKVRAVRRF